MFYYIMEAADDQKDNQAIVPEQYLPKSLATELHQRKRIPTAEALDLILHLAEALECLHQHQLIHRDIKPANIIYVRGQPKLADIDLVTDLSPAGEVTQIGTQGYMAPEGPGTAAADVFSLGRILYVALTGKSPEQCPELPTRLDQYLDSPHYMELIQISCKASETDLNRRYASARLMRDDLEKLKSGER
jgi:serine/threonine protein kinase